MSASWRVRLACTRAEAEALPFDDDAFADLDAPPTLLVDEPDPAEPDAWVLDAYLGEPPTPDLITRLYALVPSAAAGSATVEQLADADWATLSQAGLEPVRAGRFFVHTAAHAQHRRPGQIGIRIEAGLAFGTGQHFTTHGCLTALADLQRRRRFRNALDLGTGSGILALAIAKTWRAKVIASDIDPIAVDVARANARTNGVRSGRGVGAIEIVTSAGLLHPRLQARAPYDLITANILAAPLIAMAGSIVRALAPGGVLILAGLLDAQAQRVAGAYVARGCRLTATYPMGEWPTLVLVKRARRGTAQSLRRQAST